MIKLGFTKEKILHAVGSDIQLLKLVTGIDAIPEKLICSPLRNDKKPSCKFFIDSKQQSSNTLLFHDFSTGDTYNVFTFIQTLYHLKDYKETLSYIGNSLENAGIDTSLCIIQDNKEALETKFKQYKLFTSYKIKVSKADEHIINYLNTFCGELTNDILLHEGIFSLYELWKVHGSSALLTDIYKEEQLVIAYVLPSGNFKIYAPFSKTVKWLGNVNKSDVFGLHLLPEINSNDNLIITSSQKDRLALIYQAKKLGITLNVIAPQSESVLLSDEIVTALKKKYKRISIVYDCDVAGIKAAEKAVLYYSKYLPTEKYILSDMVYIENPIIKDFADICAIEPKHIPHIINIINKKL